MDSFLQRNFFILSIKEDHGLRTLSWLQRWNLSYIDISCLKSKCIREQFNHKTLKYVKIYRQCEGGMILGYYLKENIWTLPLKSRSNCQSTTLILSFLITRECGYQGNAYIQVLIGFMYILEKVKIDLFICNLSGINITN